MSSKNRKVYILGHLRAMNMAQKNLIQRIGIAGIGLGMLVQSMMPSNAIGQESKDGQFYNKRTGQYEVARPLPDVSACKYLGEKKVTDNLPGYETTIKGYSCNENRVITYSFPNGKIYGFGIENSKTGEKRWFNDYENDGNFEQEGKQSIINYSSYGY
jgi:hypothetical protein